jgi:hypothetical protein
MKTRIYAAWVRRAVSAVTRHPLRSNSMEDPIKSLYVISTVERNLITVFIAPQIPDFSQAPSLRSGHGSK